MADITRRGPDCDGERGERGERGKRGHRGHRGPQGPTGPIGNSVQFPDEFTSPAVNKTIFVRPDGSDENDGSSPAQALATLQFAITKVPLFIQAGVRYFLDVTGIDETLPPGYTLPAWKSPYVEDFYGAFDEGNAFFLFQAGVNIVADPKPASTIPLADTIINPGDVASVTFDPITAHPLVKLTAPRVSWTNANLQGKQIVTAIGGVENATISQVITNDTLELNATLVPTFPIQITEPGATLRVTTAAIAPQAGLNAINIDSISFSGLKIVTTDGQVGLFTIGNGLTLCQMCELENPDIESIGSSNNRIVRCWAHGFYAFGGSFALVNSFFSNGFGGVVGVAPATITVNRSTFDGCDPIETLAFQPGVPTFSSVASILTMGSTAIRNGNGDGIIFHGGVGHLFGIDISACNGNAITCKDGTGLLKIEANGFLGVPGAGSTVANLGLYGVEVQDGMQVVVDASVSGLPLAQQLRGTSAQQVQVGNLAAVDWATVAAPPNNVVDNAGTAATLSRLSQE